MLDDPRSNRVKGIVRLNQKDARYETGLFLLEGAQGLKELVSSPKLIEEVLVTIDGAERQAELIDSLSKKRVTITQVSDQVMAQIAGTRTPQGIVSVVQHLDVELEDMMSAAPKLVAVIDQARDPGNLGAIIRAADAAGADGIILSADSVDLYNPKVTRSTAGSIFNIPIVICRCETGFRRIDSAIDLADSVTHFLPSLPRPAVCCKAVTAKNSGVFASNRRRSSLLVESTVSSWTSLVKTLLEGGKVILAMICQLPPIVGNRDVRSDCFVGTLQQRPPYQR